MGNILTEVSEHVRKLLTNEIPKDIVYHDLMHTIEVVESAKLLASDSGLSEEESEMLQIAAWFHDTGYLKTYEGHEEESKILAENFLKAQGYDAEKIKKVSEIIMATKRTLPVNSLSDKIMRDADISHIGKKGFNAKAELLRMEFLTRKNQKFSDEEWMDTNASFISKHDFYTDSAKKYFGAGRTENLEKIQKKMRKLNKKSLNEKDDSSKDKKNAINQNTGSLIRGIQTIFRVTSGNHIDLSSIADHKANIMISVCSIIISAVVSYGMKSFHQDPKMMIVPSVLLIVCLISLVLAILSTRPNVTTGIVSKDDVLNKRGNLLFFGNFHRMTIDEYIWSMQHLINDSNYLYETLIRDIYYLGKVLGRKYQYLRWCYNIFMFGMILSVITAIIVYSVM